MADSIKITNVGIGLLTGLLVNSTIKYVGMGEGTTSSTDTDTTIESAVESRVGTNSGTQQQTDIANDTYQVIQKIVATASRAITEVGLFSASTSGSMLIRATFSPISLNTGDNLQFTLKIKFTKST